MGRRALLLLAFAPLLACGGTVLTRDAGGASANPDSGKAADATTLPEPGTVVGACGAGGSCPLGTACLFPIGSCSAAGECVENPDPSAPHCDSRKLLCGCNGTTVTTGCGTFGLATGATTGAGSQVPQGIEPDYCPEAGTSVPDAGVDAPVVVVVDAARLTDAALAACYASCSSMCVGDPNCITICEANCQG